MGAFFPTSLLAMLLLPTSPAAAERLVTVGGTVTEIAFALGAGGEVVGVDTSSVYPPAATTLPQVGYQRTLAAEGVLSLRPSRVLLTRDAGPPAAIAQIRAAGVEVVDVPHEPSLDGARAAIRAVAAELGREAKGEELVAALDAEAAGASAALARVKKNKPRVLFVYARGGGVALVSGTGTAADAMIGLAGASNAVTEFDGFRPLTAEGAVAAKPEVVLVPTRGLESLGGTAALLATPGLALTPAAAQQRVVAMDDLYLLGFGPRAGQAIAELARALHPELRAAAGGESM